MKDRSFFAKATADGRRPPVLVIGAHRSGTSATARALELLGLQIGQQLDSHREPRALQKMHEDYLRRVGASWHNPQPFLDKISTVDGKAECVSYLRENVRNNFGRIFGYRNNPKGWWLRIRLKFGAAWAGKSRERHCLRRPGSKFFPTREFFTLSATLMQRLRAFVSAN